jgi:hypothetical protein
VALAVYGASNLAKAVNESLRAPVAEAKATTIDEDDYMEFCRQVVEFVRFFCNNMYQKERYWNQAQDIVDPDKRQSAEKTSPCDVRA